MSGLWFQVLFFAYIGANLWLIHWQHQAFQELVSLSRRIVDENESLSKALLSVSPTLWRETIEPFHPDMFEKAMLGEV